MSGSFDAATDSTLVTVTDQDGHFVVLTLAGDYSQSGWTPSPDGSGGTDIVDPPAGGASGTLTISEGGSAAALISNTAPIVIDGATATIAGPSAEAVSFAGSIGSLVLDQPQNFTGSISGFTGTAPDAAHSDVIDLANINFNSGHFSDSFNASTGVLTVSDGTGTANLTFDDFKATFEFASDGKGGTDIYDPPAQTGGSHVGHGMNFGHDQIAVASNGTPPANNGPANNAPAGNGSVGIGGNDNFVFQPVNWSAPNNETAPANQPPSGQAGEHGPMSNEQFASLLTTHDAVFDPAADAAHNDNGAAAQFHQIVASAGHLH